jgi:hypothetical protein
LGDTVNVSLYYKNLKTLGGLLTTSEIITKYTELIPAIVAYRNAPDATTKTALDTAVASAQESLKTILDGLSKVPHSNLVIDGLKIEHLVGLFYTQTLREVVYSDMFTAHERIQTMATDTQTLKDNLDKMVADFVSLKYGTDKVDDKYLFTVEFAGETEISDLSELESYTHKIKLILYNYACLSEDKAESSPVINALSKDSPVTIDISWANENLPHILKLIGLSVLFYLSKKQESLKNIEIEQFVVKQVPKLPKKLAEGLQDLHSSVLDEKAITEHVKELMGKVSDKADDRTTAEQESFLRKGVEDLMELLEAGARVDVYKPETAEATDEDTKSIDSETTLIYTKYKVIEQKSSILSAGVRLKIPKKTTEQPQESPNPKTD